ncbi:hypothetical protein CCACVL1_28742 [Corchorus capsularis]|uniref:Uncharacterized protein n=1 Tax=Corchorus capsularis TaxID=210143 RepID=A0A1R3G5G3_COCAP|nr:hypothetical protein CCACVL1_28742 [Corchorus capsularis]
MYVHFNGANGFEIKQREEQYTVHLNEKRCSCRSWYLQETYELAYGFPLEPMPGMHDWNVGEENVGPQPQPPPYRGQASTSAAAAAAAASTATSSHSMGVNPQNQELNQQSKQKEPVKRKSGAANASMMRQGLIMVLNNTIESLEIMERMSICGKVARTSLKMLGIWGWNCIASFAADALQKSVEMPLPMQTEFLDSCCICFRESCTSKITTIQAPSSTDPVFRTSPISRVKFLGKSTGSLTSAPASSSSNHGLGRSSARDVENLGRPAARDQQTSATSNPKRKADIAGT